MMMTYPACPLRGILKLVVAAGGKASASARAFSSVEPALQAQRVDIVRDCLETIWELLRIRYLVSLSRAIGEHPTIIRIHIEVP